MVVKFKPQRRPFPLCTPRKFEDQSAIKIRADGKSIIVDFTTARTFDWTLQFYGSALIRQVKFDAR
jgi:hypothetical protein